MDDAWANGGRPLLEEMGMCEVTIVMHPSYCPQFTLHISCWCWWFDHPPSRPQYQHQPTHTDAQTHRHIDTNAHKETQISTQTQTHTTMPSMQTHAHAWPYCAHTQAVIHYTLIHIANIGKQTRHSLPVANLEEVGSLICRVMAEWLLPKFGIQSSYLVPKLPLGVAVW